MKKTLVLLIIMLLIINSASGEGLPIVSLKTVQYSENIPIQKGDIFTWLIDLQHSNISLQIKYEIEVLKNISGLSKYDILLDTNYFKETTYDNGSEIGDVEYDSSYFDLFI